MSQFPKSWNIKPANELCAEIVDCINKTAPIVPGPTQFKMIRTTNVKAGRVNLGDTKFVDEPTFKKWTRRLIPKLNDIVLTREAPLGEVGLLRSTEKVFLGQRTMVYRADNENLNQFFLYYSLLGPTVQAQIRTLGSGSTVEHVRVPDAEKLKIPFPKIDVQQKIAAILTAYDDLIENNKRRIALLEKMAEEIYREWFVRMRFPGHEKAKMVKGVPEGWTMTKLENAFDYYGGATPSKEVDRYWKGGDINWFTPSDITASEGIFLENSGDQCTEEGLENSSANLFPPYSIMMTSRATVGAIGINLTPACTNQGFITCLPNNQYPLPYLYHWLKLSKGHFENLSGGSTFMELTKTTFRKIEILTPPPEIVKQFKSLQDPIFKVIEFRLKEISNLEKTKSNLLPRLLSGKLSVENLDIQFPPSMRDEDASYAEKQSRSLAHA